MITLKLTLQHFLRDGVLKSSETIQSESYLYAFLCALCAQFGFNPGVCKDVHGVDKTCQYEYDSDRSRNFLFVNDPGYANMGIIPGSGSLPVALYDYNLSDLIGNGVGPGQLEWRDNTIVKSPTLYDEWADFKIQRCFVNNSGSTIYVREIGVQCHVAVLPSTKAQFLIIRDSGFSEKSVSDGECLCVTYDFQIWL